MFQNMREWLCEQRGGHELLLTLLPDGRYGHRCSRCGHVVPPLADIPVVRSIPPCGGDCVSPKE